VEHDVLAAVAGLPDEELFDVRGGAAVCEDAIAVARAAGARMAEGHARSTLGVVLAHLSDPAAGLAHLEEALRIAQDLHQNHSVDVDDVLRAYANLCDLLDLTGELERAAALAQRGVEEARQHGLERPFGAWFTADAAAVPLKLGRVGTALSACLGG
jgi:tetratricopeptide (TPR) repeat protein